jgi:hypothetical protein
MFSSHDSTARKVHALDTATGAKVGEFASSDSPHENNYSEDGSRIFHASIGMVYTPADQPVADSTKGDRWFQIVDARDYSITKRLDPKRSGAPRPWTVRRALPRAQRRKNKGILSLSYAGSRRVRGEALSKAVSR